MVGTANRGPQVAGGPGAGERGAWPGGTRDQRIDGRFDRRGLRSADRARGDYGGGRGGGGGGCRRDLGGSGLGRCNGCACTLSRRGLFLRPPGCVRGGCGNRLTCGGGIQVGSSCRRRSGRQCAGSSARGGSADRRRLGLLRRSVSCRLRDEPAQQHGEDDHHQHADDRPQPGLSAGRGSLVTLSRRNGWRCCVCLRCCTARSPRGRRGRRGRLADHPVDAIMHVPLAGSAADGPPPSLLVLNHYRLQPSLELVLGQCAGIQLRFQFLVFAFSFLEVQNGPPFAHRDRSQVAMRNAWQPLL